MNTVVHKTGTTTGPRARVATLSAALSAALGAALLLASLSSSSRAADAAGAGPVDKAQAAATGFSSERLARLDQYMRDKVATGHMPAATIMVARHGHQVMFQSYGTAQPDTIFRIYSMTKPVTGFALMLLFEEARWRFDDPVTKFLPELANVQVYKATKADGTMETEPLKRPPTMRELVTNSAGYAYGLSTDHPAEKAYQDTNFLRAASANAAVAGLATVPMFSQPGMHWHYSAASDLQGYIIERLSGMTLAEFMQRRIFGPLKMKDTAFYVPADKTARFTPVLTLDTKSNTMVPATGVLVFDYSKPPGAASGGAGLVSTTHDYARFTQMVLNGGQLDGVRIISPLALKQYMSNQLADRIRDQPDEPFQTSSGVGFAVDTAIVVDPAKAATLQGLGTISWSGAAGTWFWIDPANDLYCVGMMQVMDRWRDPALVNIEPESSALLYSALLDPRK